MPDTGDSLKIADVISKLTNAAAIAQELKDAKALDGTPLVYISQLGSSLDEAKAFVSAYVKDDAAIAALLAAYKQVPRTTEPQPTESQFPPVNSQRSFTSQDPPPTVGIELTGGSRPRLNDPLGEVAMQLPEILSASGAPGKQIQLSTLSWTDWVQIANNCNLTYALNVTRLLSKTSAPFGDERAFMWRADTSSDAATRIQNDDFPGGLRYQVSYTNSQSDAFDAGVVTSELDFTFFATASAKARWASSFATAVRERHFWVTYKDTHPMCRLMLDHCLAPSSAFVKALNDALYEDDASKAGNPKARDVLGQNGAFAALAKVLEHFGHVVAREVYLGGYYYFNLDRTIVDLATENQATLEASLKIGMESISGDAKTSTNDPDTSSPSTNPSGSGGVLVSFADKDWLAQDKLSEGLVQYPVGGNTDSRDIKSWMPTVAEPSSWAVIGRQQFVPVTDFISGDLGQQVKAVWEQGRKNAWNNDGPLGRGGSDKAPPTNDALYPVPAFWDPAAGPQAVTLVHATDMTLLQAANGVTATKPLSRSDVLPKQPDPNLAQYNDIGEQSFPVNPDQYPDVYAQSSRFWADRVGAPLRIPSSASANPRIQNALWTFVYAGECSGDMAGKVPSSPFNKNGNAGHPYYWLVTQDGESLLSAFHNLAGPGFDGQPDYFAGLQSVSHASTADPSNSPAAWMLLPADPSSRLFLRGIDSSTLFLLWNPLAGVFLGPERQLTSTQQWLEPGHDYETWDDGDGQPRSSWQPVHQNVVTRHKDDNITQEFCTYPRTALTAFSVVQAYGLPGDQLASLCWSITVSKGGQQS